MTSTVVSEYVVHHEPIKLDTREERLAYFNENAKPLFGPTWVVMGNNGYVAALGDMDDPAGFFERFNLWCDSAEAKLRTRNEGMG